MKEFLFEIIQTILVAAIPVITAFLCTLIRQKTREVAAKTNSVVAQKYINEAADAVASAVTYTSQTYVDELKKSGTFTAENQKEAIQLAKDKAVEIITAEAKDYIQSAYGDFMNYLETKIEEEVRNQKSGIISVGSLIE